MSGSAPPLFLLRGCSRSPRACSLRRGFRRPAWPAASRRQAGACYRALRRLPGRDSHPQVWTSFRGATWDKGISEIERYRQEHGIKDPHRALGRERGTEYDWSREQARERLQQRQVELQRTQELGLEREAGFSMEIGL